MEKLTIFGQIWKTGDSYVITIPKAFIRGNMVKKDCTYQISIEEEVSQKKEVKENE